MKAEELSTMQLAQPRWAVDGILPEGLSLLVGRPKLGKSWLAMELAIAVASGGRALGKIAVVPGEVLMLGLEDSWRRLQDRLLTQLAGDPPPAGLEFEREWPRGPEGVAKLTTWLEHHPETRLVVIDTLARFRAPVKRERSYDTDYSDLVPLQQLAVKQRVAVLVVHHLRKAGADDWTDQVNGTLGLAGAADGLLGLFRDRGDAKAVLKVTGRDLDEHELGLRFDGGTCTWVLLGDAASTIGISSQRRAILELIESGGPMGPAACATALGRNPNTIKTLMQRLAMGGLLTVDDGLYARARVSHPSPASPVQVTKVTETIRTTGDKGDNTYKDGTCPDCGVVDYRPLPSGARECNGCGVEW